MTFVAVFLCACPGPDFAPVYFPTAQTSGGGTAPDTSRPEAASCTVQFNTTLCVKIKGDKINIGTQGIIHNQPHSGGEGGTQQALPVGGATRAPVIEKVCAENLPGIPIEIEGTNVTLRGDKFPDLTIEGHGLPVPITINGRGETDGKGNTGAGSIEPDGGVTIDNFSLYVTALEKVGQIPALTLTTGKIGPIGDLPEISGSPLDNEGNMTLVTGTKLGHLFSGADEVLFGAAMMATFEGTISPPLKECAGSGQPQDISVSKIVVDENGKEVEVPVPDGTQLEVSTGTFISSDPTDVGPRFQSNAKFRISNTSDKPLQVKIPPVIGPFTMESPDSLNQTIAPKGGLVVRITFKPVRSLVKAEGRVSTPLSIGNDTVYLIGSALEPKGRVSVDLLDDNGSTIRENVDQVLVGEVAAVASSQRAFFQCDTISCGGALLPTKCQPCIDVAGGKCQLLAIGQGMLPLDEVTAQCKPAHPKEREQLGINYGSDGSFSPTSRLLAIRNTGPKPLTITNVSLKEIANSSSTGQFKLETKSIFVADDFSPGASVYGKPAGLPVTLPPYEPPLTTTRAFLVVGYAPTDLVGSDGKKAGVGTTVSDQALLNLETDGDSEDVQLKGTTTIKDIPPLEVYFTTATGMKRRADGEVFAFRGVTATTTDLAVPVQIRATEGATHTLRVIGAALSGPDSANFEWLDAPEEIFAKPETDRCILPLFDPSSGGQTGKITDLKPVNIAPSGYDLKPGAHTTSSMPLFGCVNFHRDAASTKKQTFQAVLTITVQQLGPNRQPIRNADGTIKQSTFKIPLLSVINPRKGKMVLRLLQTMSAMFNPQFPAIAGIASKDELAARIASGEASSSDTFVFLGSVILDPFDEETITTETGEVISRPGDFITSVFRAIDTHPLPVDYEQHELTDYTNLLFDGTQTEGKRGYFFDYPNVPAGFQSGGLKLFTTTLSNPGPIAPPEEKPAGPSQCENVDPCSQEGQRKFGEGPTQAGKKGVCAYFFASAGLYKSPAFQTPSQMPGGERIDLCATGGKSQKVLDWLGRYRLDGELTYEDGALRYWGPTYFHNPYGPLGPVPPLDEVFHITFTTGVLLPATETPGKNAIPDERINFGKLEYKINLNDPTIEMPQLCPNNTKNMVIGGRRYSSWRYLAPNLSKDPNGKIAAGCPEPGNGFSGGSAYLHGLPVDHATGVFSIVGAAKFSAGDNLTFAFKDVMTFVVLNGWLCDPTGDEAQFEGAKCFDLTFNDRDADAQSSVMESE